VQTGLTTGFVENRGDIFLRWPQLSAVNATTFEITIKNIGDLKIVNRRLEKQQNLCLQYWGTFLVKKGKVMENGDHITDLG
jgi:hypothetical protein